MTVKQDLQKPAIGSYIELFILDATTLGGDIYYLTPSSKGATANISFGGQAYIPMPIQGTGWQTSLDGAPPQPTLKVANVVRFLAPYLYEFDDFVGATVTRLQTTDKYLDSGATPDGTQVFGESAWLIIQATQNKKEIQFKLSSNIDKPSRKFPAGQMLRVEFPGLGLFST